MSSHEYKVGDHTQPKPSSCRSSLCCSAPMTSLFTEQQTSQIKCLNPITCKNQHRVLHEYGLRSLFTEKMLNRRAWAAVTARQMNTWMLTWSSSKNKPDCISWSELITVYFIFRQLIYRLYNKKTFLLLQCQPFYFREGLCRLLRNICSRICPQQQTKWSTRDMI